MNFRQNHAAVTLMAVFCLLAAIALTGCRGGEDQSAEPNAAASTIADVNETAYGIEITAMSLSAADYMLDFRYRVIDPNLAEPILAREVKPYLIHRETGAKLIVPNPPKVGALRPKTDAPEAGKIYFVMFANPGKLVKKGDSVAVVIGDYRSADLTVH